MGPYIGGNVFISGANRGIGYAFVDYLLKEWPEVRRIFAGVRQPELATELKKLCELHPERLIIIPFDITDDNSIQKTVDLISNIVEDEGLDLMINNAGIIGSGGHSVKSPSRDSALRIFDVNVVGIALSIAAFLPLIEKSVKKNNRPAKIVNISSTLASRDYADGSWLGNDFAYCASKAALNLYTKILSKSNFASNIIALALAPGWIRTRMGEVTGAPLTIEETIPVNLRTIASATIEQSGGFLERDGTPQTM